MSKRMLDLECPSDKHFQTTIAGEISFTGIGIHTGHLSKITIKPSTEDSGIVFCRIDKETGKNFVIKKSWVNWTNGSKKEEVWHDHLKTVARGAGYIMVYYVSTV